jgi:hypothetical protein
MPACNSLRLSIVAFAALTLVSGCASLATWALAVASPVQWKGQDRIEFPLSQDAGGRPTIPIRIHGKEVTAALDLGSGAPLMSRELAAALGLKVESVDKGRSMVKNVPVELEMAHVELALVLVSELPTDAQFIFGRELFSQAVVDMNFDAGQLTLTRPDAFTPPESDPLSLQSSQYGPTVQLTVNDREREICAFLDTGFNGGLAVKEKLVHELALPDIPGRTVVARGIDGRRSEGPALAPLKELRIGDLRYRDVDVIGKVPNDKVRCGFLGMAIMSKHRLVFDLKENHVWFLPRSTREQ